MSNKTRAKHRGNRPAERPSGPGGAQPTARDLPAIRRAMIGWVQDPSRNGARRWLHLLTAAAQTALVGYEYDPEHVDIAVDRWAHLLPRAEMFYIAPAASALVHHAAATLTGYRLHPEDLPSDHGLMLFAEPLRDEGMTADPNGRPITLVTWTVARNTVLMEFWCPNHYVEELGDRFGYVIPGMARLMGDVGHKLDPSRVPGQVYPRHGYLYQRLSVLVFGGGVDHDYLAGPWHDPEGEPEGEPDQDDDARDSGSDDLSAGPARVYPAASPHGDASAATVDLQKLIAATFLVMGQTITTETRIQAQTGGGTKAKRRNPEQDREVRYIDLRAAKAPPRETGGDADTGRRYRVSWFVRGHWRNQWYPSRGEHRPIWIDLHRAGPEDAPLIGGDRVNVLRR